MTRLPCPRSRARESKREFREIIADAEDERARVEALTSRLIAQTASTDDEDRRPERDYEGGCT